MDRKLSDEQLERIAENLLRDFAADDETLDEIAESPRLWWNVRNRIETEKARREQSFFAVWRRQILAFGALAMLLCFAFAALFLNFTENPNPIIARQAQIQSEREEIAQTPAAAPIVLPSIEAEKHEIPKKAVGNTQTKFVAKKQRRENLTKSPPNSPQIAARPETKTDFIALTYAGNSDSGQIVRVKVPSSMMVSLGVQTSVEKETELVNAEVVIGDDGLARAIRFIR